MAPGAQVIVHLGKFNLPHLIRVLVKSFFDVGRVDGRQGDKNRGDAVGQAFLFQGLELLNHRFGGMTDRAQAVTARHDQEIAGMERQHVRVKTRQGHGGGVAAAAQVQGGEVQVMLERKFPLAGSIGETAAPMADAVAQGSHLVVGRRVGNKLLGRTVHAYRFAAVRDTAHPPVKRFAAVAGMGVIGVKARVRKSVYPVRRRFHAVRIFRGRVQNFHLVLGGAGHGNPQVDRIEEHGTFTAVKLGHRHRTQERAGLRLHPNLLGRAKIAEGLAVIIQGPHPPPKTAAAKISRQGRDVAVNVDTFGSKKRFSGGRRFIRIEFQLVRHCFRQQLPGQDRILVVRLARTAATDRNRRRHVQAFHPAGSGTGGTVRRQALGMAVQVKAAGCEQDYQQAD